MSKRLRVPAGVVIDGEAWGGRFITPEVLIDLAAVADVSGSLAIGRTVEREYNRATREFAKAADRYIAAEDRALTHAKFRPYVEAYHASKRVQELWGGVRKAVLDVLESEAAAPGFRATVESLPPRVLAPPTPPRRAVAPVRLPEPEGDEPEAAEWQIGFDYNAKRPSSDVDINIHIRRADGGQFGRPEAERVLKHVRLTREVPVGYEISAIDWRRPEHGVAGWRSGDVTEALANFDAPMFEKNRAKGAWKLLDPGGEWEPFRFGSLKE
jgi:hypothetical protein